MSFLLDSFRNFLAGLGVTGRDKSMAQRAVLNLLDAKTLEALYRGDWLARKIVDIPAFDATRAWRQWQAEAEQIEALEETERTLNLQKKMMEGLTKARLYGGSAMVIGCAQGRFNEELDLEKIKKGDLKFVHVVERYMIEAGPRIRDILSPWFGEPSYYMRTNIQTIPPQGNVELTEKSGLEEQNSGVLFIHPSRVVRLTGLDYPDAEVAMDAWGDSALQPVYDAIRDANLVGQSIANLTSRANVNVVHVPGLTANLQTEAGTTKITNRFANANVAQSVINAILLDKDEEWEQLQVSFAGLDEIHQLYLMIASGAADIPATRLLGREPAGQNSTGESDLRNYYDRLASEQAVKHTPLLSRLDEVIIRSTFGDRDPDIFYQWNPLWQLQPAEKAELWLKKAQAFKVDVDAGIEDPEVLRTSRRNQLIEDGVYPGMEAAVDASTEAARDPVAPGDPADNDNDNDSDVPDKTGTSDSWKPGTGGRASRQDDPPPLQAADIEKVVRDEMAKHQVPPPEVTVNITLPKLGGVVKEIQHDSTGRAVRIVERPEEE